MRQIVQPVQRVRPIRLSRRQCVYLHLRRRAEVVVALVGLLVAALPMAFVAVGVLITMGRPVLFTQERMTQGGRVFRLWKFRSMRNPSPNGAAQDEDRLMPFGRFIRSTSLDELPSLWNIVRGDMGLIGPRPLPTYYLGRFSAEQFARHSVPAGLTGHAQVHGRNEVEWDTRMSIDLQYIEQIGLRLDLQILVDTVGVVLRRKGVHYADGLTRDTDFPGPQSTTDLVLEGPDEVGTWTCRDRRGQALLSGTVQILEGDVARLGPLRMTHEAAGRGVLLEEALLLLVSRLRAAHRISWACIAPDVELPDELAVALERNGFVPPDADVGFPTEVPAPSRVREEAPSLIAFVERPQIGFRPPAPLLSVWPEERVQGF